MTDETPLVSIVLPAYNEEEAIGPDLDVINAAMSQVDYAWELIVVDDGSRDRTAEISREKGARVVTHERNRGNGAARNTGVRASRGRIVVMTDADGTYPNQVMPEMIEEMKHCDMVIGARAKEKGTMKLLRTPAKWFIRRLAMYLTETDIPDLNSGLRAFKKDVVAQFMHILPNTHSWVSTITIAMLANDYAVHFMPIDYYKRVGKSTFHPLRDSYNYIRLVIRTVMLFNPLKFFLPGGALVLLLGVAKTGFDLFIRPSHDIKESDIFIMITAFIIWVLGLLADLIVVEHKARVSRAQLERDQVIAAQAHLVGLHYGGGQGGARPPVFTAVPGPAQAAPQPAQAAPQPEPVAPQPEPAAREEAVGAEPAETAEPAEVAESVRERKRSAVAEEPWMEDEDSWIDGGRGDKRAPDASGEGPEEGIS